MTDNQRRAAELVPDSVPAYYRGPAERGIAAALDAAEARGRAEVAAKVEALANEMQGRAAATNGWSITFQGRLRAFAAAALIAPSPAPVNGTHPNTEEATKP